MDRQTLRKSGKTRHRGTFMVSGGLLFLLITILICWDRSFRRVDLNEQAVVAFSGFDTKGSVSVSFQPEEGYEEFYRTVEASVTPNGNLSNGEQVTIQFSYDENLAKELRMKVKAEEQKTEVTGLSKGQQVTLDELFANLKITYEGVAPQVKIGMENISEDPFFGRVSFLMEEPKEFYRPGDIFRVRAVFDEEEAVRLCYEILGSESDYEKVFTVSDVDSYLTNGNELTAEHKKVLADAGKELLHDANDYGLRIFSEANLMPIWIDNKTTFQWSNPRLLSMYFHSVKDDVSGKTGTHQNDLECIYMAMISQADGVGCEAEVVVRFTDLIQKADGSIDLSLDTGEVISASYRNANIKQLISNDDDYVTEKLSLSE